MAIYDLDEADYQVGDAHFAVVAARFNGHYVDRLLQGAIAAFARHGIAESGLTIVRVPGAFEIPLCTQVLASRDDVDAVIGLGCVLRGDTAHFEYVCGETARGITLASLKTGKPVIFGVLTLDTDAQAVERTGGPSGTEPGNKGDEAALAAMEMVSVLRRLV